MRQCKAGHEELLALDLAVTVADAVALIGGEIREKGISLSVVAAEGLPWQRIGAG
jgi:hypothetical protein